MSDDTKELAKAVEAAASSAQGSDHWAGFYALKVGPAGNVYEEVPELGSVSVVIDDLLTDIDARDAEIAAERAARERAEAETERLYETLAEVYNIGDQWHPNSFNASVEDAAVEAIGRMQSAIMAVFPQKKDTTHDR